MRLGRTGREGDLGRPEERDMSGMRDKEELTGGAMGSERNKDPLSYSRRPGQWYFESQCVKQARSPFTQILQKPWAWRVLMGSWT